MKVLFTTTVWIAVLSAGITATLFLHAPAIRAADSDFPIYMDDSTILLKTQTVKGVLYLPLADIVRNFNLPYTNDTAQEAFTVRGANSQVVLTRNSAVISVNNQITLLPNPVLHDNGVWLVPVEFLQQGLSRVTTTEFRRRAGSPRAFAGRAKPADLAMSSQSQSSLTRLTLRTSTPVSVELKRETAQHRAVLVFAPKPIDPARESVDFKDRLVQSINFNDSDGSPKVVVAVSDDVSDIRVSSSEENRVHVVDFIRKTESTEAAPPPAAPGPAGESAAARRQEPAPLGGKTNTAGVRVIVIDPGHGGIDAGASTMGALEKDITLALARKLRTTLQSRLGATVLLTRDSDVALTSEARAAVANNNRADLFISLHVGYSANKAELGSSVYVIQENFAASILPATEKTQRLFLPWYLGYRTNRESSVKAATVLSEELSSSLPGWTFPIRTGPVGVLASTVMPAVLIEIGNLNNPASTQALLDDTFQSRFGTTVAGAVERFAPPRQANK
jgi:N-acetylmuramoyl-L-alanine amidase